MYQKKFIPCRHCSARFVLWVCQFAIQKRKIGISQLHEDSDGYESDGTLEKIPRMSIDALLSLFRRKSLTNSDQPNTMTFPQDSVQKISNDGSTITVELAVGWSKQPSGDGEGRLKFRRPRRNEERDD